MRHPNFRRWKSPWILPGCVGDADPIDVVELSPDPPLSPLPPQGLKGYVFGTLLTTGDGPLRGSVLNKQLGPQRLLLLLQPPLRLCMLLQGMGEPVVLPPNLRGANLPSEIRIHHYLQLGDFGTFGVFIFVCFGWY